VGTLLAMGPLSEAALEFARGRHEGQRREADDQPFVVHPEEVAKLLDEAGYPDHVVAAGALHDVLEDTDAEGDELEDRFGPEVSGLVRSLTEDPSVEDKAEQRAALRGQVKDAGEEAAAIFAADKISKAREVRLKAEHGDLTDDDHAKIEHYERSLEMLEESLAANPLVGKLRHELEPLRAAI
jgi:(p)ppGpp synthase/HD superfamily hydrolase